MSFCLILNHLFTVEDSGTSTSTTTESSTPSETTDISTSPTYTDTSTIWSRSPTPSYTTITSTKAMVGKYINYLTNPLFF